MYLLDTTHCIEALDGNPHVLRLLTVANRAPTGACMIVRAELLFMSYRSRRIAENIAAVELLLSGLRDYPIDALVAEAFGELKSTLLDHFGPKDSVKQRRFKLQHLGISDNELWIAAIALRHDLIVVTSDGDFTRIAEVTDLRHESWLGNER